jgi:hypothetical protein
LPIKPSSSAQKASDVLPWFFCSIPRNLCLLNSTSPVSAPRFFRCYAIYITRISSRCPDFVCTCLCSSIFSTPCRKLPYVHPITDFIFGVLLLTRAPEISFDPENWTHSTSPISRSTTVQNEGSPSTSLFDSHRHHLPQYRLASLHRPSNFIPRQSLLPL